jgi:3-deoxy-D-manno-octulosonate 8-phosphate phosphatase KdsC-like HAD superfamily phosphatase
MPEGWANLMYFGNDLNDLGCMELAAFGMCPSDGHERIKAVSFYVAKKPGGSGFIREVIEFLLDSNSKRS